MAAKAVHRWNGRASNIQLQAGRWWRGLLKLEVAFPRSQLNHCIHAMCMLISRV